MKLKTVRAYRGMVAAGHPLATAEGLAVMRAGGNAVDAAIAAAAVLAVVSPQECGLGGDLFAVIHDASTGSVHALNASGRSPAAATLERYAHGIPVSGPLSMSVPGMIGGWGAAVARFGSRPLGELLAGAIEYAESGFPAYDGLIENAMERTESIFADAHAKALFFPQGRALREGERVRQPGAAATLREIASSGTQAFYQGRIAASLASYIQGAGGILSAQDFSEFEPLWQEAMEVPFRGYRVCSVPPNSWGAALLLQLLAMEHEGIAAAAEEAAFVLQGIRTRRLAYQLLAGCVADPAVSGNLAHLALKRFLTESEHAQAAAAAAGIESGTNGTDTSNVLAVDAAGNAVSLLQSVFVPFGSGVLAPETGVLMNNRMRGFSTRAEDPNCLMPRKRPAQTLTPALVMRGDEIWMVCGTPGGPGQTGSVAQFLARVLARSEDMAEAIAAPRWSITLAGDFILEDSAPAAVCAAVLAAEPGVKVTRWGSVNFGSLAAILRDGEGWIGCVDSRRNAAVLGF